MENPEGVLNLLDEFAKLKSKEIPSDLEEYLSYVASSGDPVYQWSLIKSLYRQKLINVISEFYEMCPVVEIPRCPNVDPFNYETMKNSLLKRLDSFSSAPFTIQRISELLTTPRKQYNRVDKFMRAIEKNIWVVSTREPGPRESNNQQDTSASLVNGVSPRVCVTVKHPKRVKSIEERIKSGHPQLIDDEEEEEEGEEMHEYERMEEEPSTEILPNNEADDSSLQCTSVKDLIEKYENGTIFSNSEEKTDFEEKSGQIEEPTVTTSTITIAETTTTTTTTVAISVSPEILCSSQTESQSISEVSNVTQPKEAAPMYKTEEALNTDPKNCESEQKPIGLVTSEPDSPQESKAQDEKPDALVLCSTIDIPLEKPQLLTESSTSKISESPIVLDSSLGKVADAEAETSSLDVLSNSGDDFQPTRDTSLNLDLEIKTDSVSKTDESL